MSIFDASSTSPGTEEGKMGKFQEDMSRTLDELRRNAANQTGQGGRMTAAGLNAMTHAADIQKGLGLGMAEIGSKERMSTAANEAGIKGHEISAAPSMLNVQETWKPIPGSGNLLASSMPNSASRKFGIGTTGDTTTISNTPGSLTKETLDSLKIPGFGF